MRKWIKCKKDRFLKSKFLCFLLGLIIGSTLIFNYLVAKPIVLNLLEGYNTASVFLQIRANKGQDSESLPDPAEDSYVEEKVSKPIPPSILSIVDAIHFVESNHGKDLSGLHGKCVAQGKDNSYSYGKKCYENEEKTKEIVIDWFERKTKTMSLETALCYFGGAGKVSSCDYANKINLIK